MQCVAVQYRFKLVEWWPRHSKDVKTVFGVLKRPSLPESCDGHNVKICEAVETTCKFLKGCAQNTRCNSKMRSCEKQLSRGLMQSILSTIQQIQQVVVFLGCSFGTLCTLPMSPWVFHCRLCGFEALQLKIDRRLAELSGNFQGVTLWLCMQLMWLLVSDSPFTEELNCSLSFVSVLSLTRRYCRDLCGSSSSVRSQGWTAL